MVKKTDIFRIPRSFSLCTISWTHTTQQTLQWTLSTRSYLVHTEVLEWCVLSDCAVYKSKHSWMWFKSPVIDITRCFKFKQWSKWHKKPQHVWNIRCGICYTLSICCHICHCFDCIKYNKNLVYWGQTHPVLLGLYMAQRIKTHNSKMLVWKHNSQYCRLAKKTVWGSVS